MSLQLFKLQHDDVCSFDNQDEVFHIMEVVSRLALSFFNRLQPAHSSLCLFYFYTIDLLIPLHERCKNHIRNRMDGFV
jgi:hypothetical protein